MQMVTYSRQKGSRLYYEVHTQGKHKPKCCEKREARSNKDINWSSTFKKMQNIPEIKPKWFQIRLVHRILATNIVLMHMGIEKTLTALYGKEILSATLFGDVCTYSHSGIYE